MPMLLQPTNRSLPLIAAAIAGLAAGCAATDDATPQPRKVSLAEFAEPALVADGTSGGTETDGRTDGTDGDAYPLGASSGSAEQVTIVTDADEWHEPAEATSEGSPLIIDSLIGQVNGRPIFADEFFEPIEDELIALSRQLDAREFAFKAHEIVQANLQQVVLNELFLAEAESGLTQDQQIGVFYWLRQLREQLVSSQGGTVSQTEEQMQAQEGVSLEEYLDETKKRALIAQLLDQKIAPRVIVSWRDIEREYERRRDQFNPPSQVTLARIRLATGTDAEVIADVQARLDAGEAFETIAVELGQWNEGSWQQFEVGEGGLGDIELNETARQQLSGLEVGETTPAFELGTSTWWLHVTALDQPPQYDLYDPMVQRRLAVDLYQRRSAEERNQYIESLFDKGIYDELNEMSERLLLVALIRYAPDS